MSTSQRVCPFCDGSCLVRSRRKPLEIVLSLLAFYPFRCEDCSLRSLHFEPGEGRTRERRSA